MFDRLSISTKICLAAAACTVLSLTATGLAVGVQSGRQAEAAAQEQVLATARFAAQQVQAELRSSFSAVQSLGLALAVTRDADRPPARDDLDRTLKQLLEKRPTWLASYALFEPNALDGKDADHVKKGPQHDDTGRFASYWNRAAGPIAVEPLVDYEKPGLNDWYDIPRRTGKTTLVEPYLYKISGKDTLITSLVVPIQAKGRFVGAVGLDMLLEGMQKTMAGIAAPAGATLMLVSNGGKFVSHPDAAQVGQAAKVLPPEALTQVRQGQPYQFGTGDTAHVLVPVQADPEAAPWSLYIAYDNAATRASALAALRLSAGVALGCAVLAVLVLVVLVTRLTRPVRNLAATMEALAGGQSNLRVALPVAGHDELATIADAFNRFVAKLRSTFEEVRSGSAAIDGAAGEISSGNLDLSTRTEQQASRLQEISAQMAQLAEGVRQSVETAQQADALSRSAGAAAQRSQGVMDEAVQAMGQVQASSQRIADITAVIDGIAFQTNILALNAAVEAARAGEHGRGFSVVASEVRSLAQRAAVAAKDIKSLIGESVARIELGTDRIRSSGDAVVELVRVVGQTSDLVGTISQASHAQSSGIAQVESAITELDGMTQQNAALVEEAAAAASSMKAQTQRLTGTLGVFI